MQKGALVLEGGSLRGMFTAGVLDILMDGQVWFEYVNGVSAGSLCGYNYIARQPGRSREINETFCNDKRYLGFDNLLHNGGVFNFDFLFGEIADVLFPSDHAAFDRSPQQFEAVATDCLTGTPAYFCKQEMTRTDFDLACRASSSMPGLSDIVWLNGVPYLDGGCSCGVAYERALHLGYDKVVVILTRPEGFRKKPEQRSALLRAFCHKYSRYPALCTALRLANRRYNALYANLEQLERQGRVFVIRPDQPVIVGRLERNVQKLEALYQDGRQVMLDQIDQMMSYLHG